MANYSADIRVGIVGKNQLNSLEAQLKRVNTQVNKLNKALVLKTRAQTIKLNTKGASSEIKKLEDRINRLGRTVTVNLRTNEQRETRNSSGSGGGGGVSTALAVSPATQFKQANVELRTFNGGLGKTEEELKGINKILSDRDEALRKQNELTEKRNALIDDQAKKIKAITDVETSRNDRARTANQNRLFGGKEGRTPPQAQNDAELSIQASGRRIKQLNKNFEQLKLTMPV